MTFNVLNFIRLVPLVLIALSGCASIAEQTATPVEEPAKIRVKPAAVPTPAKIPAKPAAAIPAAIPVIAAAPVVLNDQQSRERAFQLLPGNLKDKDGWALDLQNAFKALNVSPSNENYCAVIAIIGQESSFQADPLVPGLPAIVKREIEQRRIKYSIPTAAIDWMLSTSSRDGRTYQQRIDTLKTEKELSDLVEDIVASIPAGKKLFSDYNPVHTGGPMQVSVEFAEAHARARPYPYAVSSSLRNEVFSRRGGLYFGTANLLDYPAPYDNLIYRFADYNAGRYSSRNAAFQLALVRISGRQLAPDGDLLSYRQNVASSNTQNALFAIKKSLQMSESEIQRDLRLEKLSTFSLSPLYERLFTLADQQGAQPRASLPQIDLKSPKITRKLTTEWFAKRVETRYKSCLKHAMSSNPSRR